MAQIDWKKELDNFRKSQGTIVPEQPTQQPTSQQAPAGTIDWNKELADFRKNNSTTTQDIPTNQNPSVLENIRQHPFKAIMQPVSKTLGGKTAEQMYQEKVVPKMLEGINYKSKIPIEINPKVLQATLGGMSSEIVDMLQSPITYIPLPIGKLLGKIPFKGTTVGEIAKNIPLRKGFIKNIEEFGKYQQALKNLSARVTESQVPLNILNSESNPVPKIIQALQEAKPIRGQQEALYSIERSKRAGQIIEAGQTVPGEQGYFAQLKAAKGQLPKVQFEGIRGKVSQPDVDNLFNMVERNTILSPYEKLSAKTGLSKLLGAEGGVVPTEGEIKLLSQVFPQDFIGTVLSKRPLMQKLFQGVEEVLNVPRAIMASADMSAPLRQGIFLIGRPKQWMPAFRDMFKYAFNEKAYQGLMQDIEKRPTYPLMKESGLSLTGIGTQLSGREEKFMSNLSEKIPVLGHIVRGSNRAYTGFLNKLRADVFDDMVNSAQKLGLKPDGKLLTDIGNFVSTATGRGKLPGALEKSAVILNTTFFSPRLMVSRINLLRPDYYVRLDPFVRKEALKSLLTFTGTAISIMTLAKMGGADIGVEPRSADFAKIKTGNTRYDVWGGFQQYLRVGVQLLTGEHISSTTGVKTTIGEGYKPINRLEILGRFLQTKEAPVVSFATSLLMGKSSLGKKLDIPTEVAQRFVPMVVQDMYDLYKERGLEGLGMAVPGIFGTGLQTYSPNPTEIVYSTNSVINHTKELLKQGRKDEAVALVVRNRKLLQMGQKLEPLQKELSKYEKAKELLGKNVILTPEQKKKVMTYTDMMIKKFGNRMEQRYKEIK